MTNSIVLIFSIFFVNNIFAAEFGKAIVSGAGCPTKNIQLVVGKNTIPLKSSLIKKENQSLLREACNLRVTVKTSKNEKIQLGRGVLELDAKIPKDATATASLHLGFTHIKEFSSSNAHLFGDEKTVLKTQIAESQCGKESMIALNYNLSASGKGEVTLNSSDLNIEIKVVSCN